MRICNACWQSTLRRRRRADARWTLSALLSMSARPLQHRWWGNFGLFAHLKQEAVLLNVPPTTTHYLRPSRNPLNTSSKSGLPFGQRQRLYAAIARLQPINGGNIHIRINAMIPSVNSIINNTIHTPRLVFSVPLNGLRLPRLPSDPRTSRQASIAPPGYLPLLTRIPLSSIFTVQQISVIQYIVNENVSINATMSILRTMQRYGLARIALLLQNNIKQLSKNSTSLDILQLYSTNSNSSSASSSTELTKSPLYMCTQSFRMHYEFFIANLPVSLTATSISNSSPPPLFDSICCTAEWLGELALAHYLACFAQSKDDFTDYYDTSIQYRQIVYTATEYYAVMDSLYDELRRIDCVQNECGG